MFKADLHTHTHFSDGVLSVEDLLLQAKAQELQAISITDHDTLNAYTSAFDLAKFHDLILLPGFELSTYHESTCVHVLAYGFELEHERLNETLSHLAKERTERIEKIFARLKKRTLNVDLEEFVSSYPYAQLGRAHIADYLVKLNVVKTIPEAFDHYLGDKQVGSLLLKTISTLDGIQLIQEAKGFAVLAHPYLIKHKNQLRKILTLPFDGIEVYYSNYPRSKTASMEQYALEHNKILTGGSDFHRPQPHQSLGCSFTPKETFDLLFARHQQNNQGNYSPRSQEQR